MSKKMEAPPEQRVTWKGWIALIILILLFSGIFQNSAGPLAALDFTNLTGSFGAIADGLTFQGKGGSGAKDGFLFALTLIPTVCLAVGMIDVVESLGAMGAAAKLFNPLLRPLLGIPGTAGIAFVSSFTSSDVAAFMTKQLYLDNNLSDGERTIFAAYQYAGSAVILNTISTQAPLLPIALVAMGPILIILIVCKLLGANLIRILLRFPVRRMKKEAEAL